MIAKQYLAIHALRDTLILIWLLGLIALGSVLIEGSFTHPTSNFPFVIIGIGSCSGWWVHLCQKRIDREHDICDSDQDDTLNYLRNSLSLIMGIVAVIGLAFTTVFAHST